MLRTNAPRALRIGCLSLALVFAAQSVAAAMPMQDPPPAAAQAPTTDSGCPGAKAAGAADAAAHHGGGGWFAGGFAGGLVLGLIGTGVMTAIAASTSPEPQQIPAGLDPNCYGQGYTKKAKAKNRNAALGGGLVGTVVIVAILVSAQSGN